MIIKKLKLKNFRQFKGEQEIIFSTDIDKNVTVVEAENTCGKTTLLQSLFWVLYGELNLDQPQDLLNHEIRKAMLHNQKENMYVQIEIEYEKDLYRLTRGKSYSLQNQKFVESNTITKLEKFNERCDNFEEDTTALAYENLVNIMIPKNLSEYFFFDGERIKTLGKETKESSKSIAKSIKDLLGLTNLIKTLEILKASGPKNCVVKSFRNEYDYNNTTDKKRVELEQKIKEYEKNPNKYDDEITKLEKINENLEKIMDDSEVEMQKHEASKKIQFKVNSLKNAIKEYEHNRENIIDNHINNVGNYIENAYYKKVNNEISDIFNKLEIKEIGVPEMRIGAIDYLLKRKVCICGRPFEEHGIEYNTLIEERRKLPPVSAGEVIRKFKKEYNKKVKYIDIDEIDEKLNKNYSSVVQIGKNIFETEKAKEREELKLDGIVETKISWDKYTNALNAKNRNNNIIEDLNKKKEDADKNYAENIEEIKQYNKVNNKNIKIDKYIAYTEKIYKYLNLIYLKREKELRETLEVEMNKFLEDIYTGERKVKITPDYKIELKYVEDEFNNEISSQSTGLGIIKAISFVEALVKTASIKRMEGQDADDEFPFVLDAPFSTLDEEHMKNTIKSLPPIANQVIIFTMKKDIDQYKKDENNKIGKSYYLNKVSEKYTEIKED